MAFNVYTHTCMYNEDGVAATEKNNTITGNLVVVLAYAHAQ